MLDGVGVQQPSPVLNRKPTDEKPSRRATPAGNFWRDPRPTNKNPNFVHDYFRSSRLHFIGSFRARYESMMVSVATCLNVHPSLLLKPPPKRKPNVPRIIVHIDMDCFFASIAVTKNPQLRGKCIAVCHGGGEISSCSYEARAYGVRAGMFCKNARKLCPQLLNVDYDFPSYEKVSIQIYSFFHDYPGICVEAVSVDEAYLDITDTIGKDTSQSNAEALVSNLRNRIQMETGCTASAGIGPSKLVARLATKGAKPDGQLRIRQEGVIKYLDTLSVKDLPGIGWRTSKRLAERAVKTVPQLRAQSLSQLQTEFGERQGQVFHDLARALDSRPVEPLRPRKSIGAEASWGVRFEQDETDKVKKFIHDMAEEVATRVTASGAYGKKLTYKVYRRIPRSSMAGWKYLGHGPCSILTKSAKLSTNCVGDALKCDLKKACLSIHEKWGIRHDEFRGVGIQMIDLRFADLNFDHAFVPVNGTRRIDAFFSAANQKKKANAETRDPPPDEHNKVLSKNPDAGQERGAPRETVNVKDEGGNAGKECSPAQEIQPVAQLQAHDASRNGDYSEDGIEAERKGEEPETRQEIAVPIPEGWDRKVFEELPLDLQQDLLREKNLVSVPQNAINTLGAETRIEQVEPMGQARPVKHKRSLRNNREALQKNLKKRARRKQSGQVTMTQCADISELKKIGHAVLDADEFREKPLKEVVQLLDDLKPRRRVAKTLTFKKQGTDAKTLRGDVKVIGTSEGASNEKMEFDIPSPPSLSSDSGSSCGVAAVVEKQGFVHSRIYAEENIWDYASKLKAWMVSVAEDVRTGHTELVRGRVLEMVYLKELDRACAEMRTIREFSNGEGMGLWKESFNELLAEVHNETCRLYGFRLAVRPLE